MIRFSLEKAINTFFCLYIITLYLFTFREGLNFISNGVASVLIFFIWMNVLGTKRKIIFNKLLITYFLFIVVCIISILYALDQELAVTKTISLSLIFLLMVSLVNYIDNYEKLQKIIRYFVYGGVIASVYILTSSDLSEITRFGEELGNVNEIGIIIGISCLLCVHLVLSEHKYKYVYLSLLPVMIAAILLTGSRKSLLFLIFGILIELFLVNHQKLKNMFKFLVIAALLFAGLYYAIITVPVLYEVLGHRMEILFNYLIGEGVLEGSSLDIRSHMIDFGIEMFKSNPFSGYGIDNYRVLYGSLSGFITYGHNNYIELLVDIGIFGVCLYYLTHIIVVWNLFNISHKNIYKFQCYVFIAIIIPHILLSISMVYYSSKHFSVLLALASTIQVYKIR